MKKDFRSVLRRWMASFGRVIGAPGCCFHFTDQESEAADVEFAFEPPIASSGLVSTGLVNRECRRCLSRHNDPDGFLSVFQLITVIGLPSRTHFRLGFSNRIWYPRSAK